MINKESVVQINGVYVSLLFKDWYAAEYVVNLRGEYFRIRMPYKTREAAEKMIAYLCGKRPTMPAPDWRPVIHMMPKEKQR